MVVERAPVLGVHTGFGHIAEPLTVQPLMSVERITSCKAARLQPGYLTFSREVLETIDDRASARQAIVAT